jgi:hypothetical protein
MSGLPYFRALWLVGLALLAVAQGDHECEHWEIATHAQCFAHSHGSSDHDEGGPQHDHGCTSHDHAPALSGAGFVLTVAESVALLFAEFPGAPAELAASIDQPPRLS